MSLIVYTILSVFQLLFACGIQVLNHFTTIKLGMNRWVVYHNMQINKIGFISYLKYFIGIISIIYTIKIIKDNFKYFKTNIRLLFDNIVLLILNIIFLILIFFYDTKTQKLNYFYIIILLLIYILQVIKAKCINIKSNIDFSKTDKSVLKKIGLALLIVALALIYFFSPTVNTAVNNAINVLKSGNIDKVVEFIRSYGNIAAVISFLLMVLQSVLAPIPAFLITFANAIIFGWWQGAILSYVSSMVGATLCFYIARIFGRDVVVKFTTNSALNQMEEYFNKYGSKTILICRLLPFISFDLVSYFAGLTSMSLGSFLIATGIGQLPATIIYSYVGGMLTGKAQVFVTALLLIFALSIFIVMLKQIFNDKNKKR